MASQFLISRTAIAVRDGGVIAYPTEAVYGLGCDPDDPDAIAELLEIKQRPVEQGLILIAASIGQLENYMAPLSDKSLDTLAASWPGPQTWVVPAAKDTPPWLTGKHSGIAVRVTAHPMARALCQRCGHALVSTSANLSGHPPARNARTVRRMLGDRLAYILEGPVGQLASPTPIIDLLSGTVLRSAV